MNENNGSFLDSKTIIAIVLVAVGYFTWDSYMRSKYPHTYERNHQQTNSQEKQKEKVTKTEETIQKNTVVSQRDNDKDNDEKLEVFHKHENDWFSFIMTSKGMGLYDVVLKKYTDREGFPIKIGNKSNVTPFETNLTGRTTALDFSIEKVSDNKFVGKAFHGPMTIVKTLSINPANYTVNVDVRVSDITVEFLGLTTYLSDIIEEGEEQSLLIPSFGGQEIFTLNSEGQDRVFVSDIENSNSHKSLHIAAVGTQYFVQAVLDKSDVVPNATFFKDSNSIIGRLNHSILNRSSEFSINYTGFVGPKSAELLESLDSNLPSLIDLGWFSWIGKILLKLMKMFYSLSGNWGVAIILMTLLVRLILLPLNVFSYKSMKKMQVIQPEIKAIREEYKEDPQRMNREVMALMKQNKANPLSGCLPMLLQFPIFIALYRVLGQSIELYQAPFGLWIQDLSLKDPFYVLPILMGLSMFVQMKIQPNTMEPAQRKIMMFMPIMFTFFMLGLPSGLTLYILVSTLFAILQHFYFMREPVKAPAVTA